jgi:hypothetical protein
MSQSSDETTIDKAQRRLNRKERKAKRLAMVKAIQRMRDDGFSTQEVAAALGVTLNAAHKAAARHLGVPINIKGSRRLGAWVPAHAVLVVKQIADRTGRSPSYVAGRLLAIALENDGRLAMRMLGKEAMAPKHSVPDQGPSKRELQREAREAREREERERRGQAKAAEAARQAMKERMRG